MSILGTDLADVHGDWDGTWMDVGLDNLERILWGYAWCFCGWNAVVVIVIVGKGIIQRIDRNCDVLPIV